MEPGAACRAVVERLAAATPEDQPFPHAYVRDVFPAEFYRELRAMLPPEETLSVTDPRRSTNPYAVNRRKFHFAPEDLAKLDDARRSFWREMIAGLGGRELADVVLERFGAGIARRYGDRRLDPETRVEINIDGENYAISPHTDHPGKIATLLFYLPEDASRSDLGTAIFVPKDRRFRSEQTPQHPFALFDKVRSFPYVPNSCFLFLKTDNSFHGRERVDGPTVRRPMLFVTIQHRQAAAATGM